MLYFGIFGYAIYLNYNETNEPKDLGDLIEAYEDDEGVYAKIDMNYIPYGFAEEGTDRHYYFASDKEGYLYIIRIQDSTYEKLEAMCPSEEDGTLDYVFKGYTFKIPAELKKLAIEVANEDIYEEETFTYSNFEDYVGTVYIDETDKPSSSRANTAMGIGIIAGVFTVVLIIAAVSQFVSSRKTVKNTELIEELKTELQGLDDNPYKKLKIYLTSRYIISKYGGLEAIKYRDVIWEYPQIRYTNGVASGKTLIICTTDKKKHALAQSGPNDASIDEIMTEIKDKNPEVRIGYTKENREFFKSYQKVEKTDEL